MESHKNILKILFINPPSPDGFVYIRDTNRSGRRSAERTIWPQTSLAMLAGVFNDHKVEIVDCIAERLDYNALYERMKEFAPDWVVSNPISSIFTHDMIVIHFAKSLNAKTAIISPHAKALKEEVYGRFPALDYIVSPERGGYEPEYLLREIITGESAAGTSFEGLPPARQDLLPTKRYSMPFIGRNFSFVVIARGCPYKCIYCRQGVMYEGAVRYRSVDSVVREIEKYKLRNVALHADTATLNKDWIYEFCDKVPYGVRWICNSRVDTVSESMLRVMADNGCWMVCYGIESGDDEILFLNKKGATCEEARQAVKWTKEAGIKVWGYFMLGLYGDTYETMQRTIDFSKELDCDLANFAISCPYPGTEWNRIARENYWLGEDPIYDQNYSAIVDRPQCSRDLVQEMQKHAYLSYYVSLRGIRTFLCGITSWAFLSHVIADHIRSIFKKTARPDLPVARKEMD